MHICMYGNYPSVLSQHPAIFSLRDFLSCLWSSTSYPLMHLPSLTSPFFPWTLIHFSHSQHPSERFRFVFGFCFGVAFGFCFWFFFTSLAVQYLNKHHLLLILNLVPTGNQRLIQWLVIQLFRPWLHTKLLSEYHLVLVFASVRSV